MKKTLYLMRHGQTMFNLYERMQGWCDSPLTEKGVEQAKIAGDYFKRNNVVIDKAYTSTSTRTIDTLEYAVGMPSTQVKNLREWGFGKLEGTHGQYAPEKPFNDFYIQFGGEGQTQVVQRYSAAIEEIAQSQGDSILVVSHGAVMRLFAQKHKENAKVAFDGFVDNCMIMKYTYEDGNYILEEIIKHDYSSLPEDVK